MSGSEINIASYNQICNEWLAARSKMPINRCIADFTKLLKANGSVLDIGCGGGYPIDVYLEEKGFCVTGIDISDKMIEKANSLNLPNAEFIQQDLLSFSTEKKYDGIIAFDSLWHIEKEHQREIYKKLSSLAADRSYLLFTHGKQENITVGEMFGEKFYYAALDKKEVHLLLEANGFRVISSIEDYAEQTTGDRDLLIVAQKVF